MKRFILFLAFVSAICIQNSSYGMLDLSTLHALNKEMYKMIVKKIETLQKTIKEITPKQTEFCKAMLKNWEDIPEQEIEQNLPTTVSKLQELIKLEEVTTLFSSNENVLEKYEECMYCVACQQGAPVIIESGEIKKDTIIDPMDIVRKYEKNPNPAMTKVQNGYLFFMAAKTKLEFEKKTLQN